MNTLFLRRIVPIILFLVFCAAMTWVQFSTPDLIDNDGFYHIKMAQLMREEGLFPEFSWLPLTILNPREYYDHHFLFHVALIPFTYGDLVIGAKLSAVVFSALAFLSIWYFFERQQVKFAWLWALGLLGVSEAFLYRMNIPRAQSLSVAMLALGMTWLLDRQQWKKLGLLAFVYVWLYDAFPLLLILTVLYVISAGIIERRYEARPILFVLIGTFAGMFINPYFPHNIVFTINHLLPKLTEATSISVGNEWYPYTTGQLLDNSLPALGAFASGIFALGLSSRKMDVRVSFGLLTCLMFGLMLFQSRRFVEYFPPFTLVFVCFAWQPFFEDAEKKLEKAVLILIVFVFAFVSLSKARVSMGNAKPSGLYAESSAWLMNNSPEGDLVFQTDWDDFPRLFFYNHHNSYLIGLDPTYLQLADPQLYDLWVKISQGKVSNISEVVLNKFGARYIHTDLKHTGFIRAAEKDTNIITVFRADDSIIYMIVSE